MKINNTNVLLVCLASIQLVSGCRPLPTETDTPIATDLLGDVVPQIDYPDFYLASQGFGFNLPRDWSGSVDQSTQTFHFARPPYNLTIYYAVLQTTARDLLTGLAPLAGKIEINGFWGDTLMHKFRFADAESRATLVAYIAQDQLNGVWLMAYLECSGEGCQDGIPAEIEAQADWLLASYEEHGWEE